MNIIILTLLFGLLGYATSKPLETNDATSALVDNWHPSAIHSWPFQAAPLTAYSSFGLQLLTPGQLETIPTQTQAQTKAVAATVAPSPTNYVPQLLQPQYFTAQQYFVSNNAYYSSPFAQYAYATSQQFVPQVLQTQLREQVATTTTTTTQRPRVKDTEPTTRKPKGSLRNQPPKLQAKPQSNIGAEGDFKNDAPLLRAVKNINPEYVIEDIMSIPGKLILSTTNTEKIVLSQKHSNPKPSVAQKPTSKLTAKKTLNRAQSANVKVEATGKTSTTGNIPEIPFGTYFLPYFSQGQQAGTKTAALILEPHSKAIVGNGGTAISTPISRAYLKRGVATNVYFNPESVAIAGVGGKAHAQADLELDLID